MMDTDQNGTVSLPEWLQFCEEQLLSHRDMIRGIFCRMDTNASGTISRDEFILHIKESETVRALVEVRVAL